MTLFRSPSCLVSLSSHIFIWTCPFYFSMMWRPSATSIYLSVSYKEPGIKSETCGVIWHVAPESKIQLVNCELSPKSLLEFCHYQTFVPNMHVSFNRYHYHRSRFFLWRTINPFIETDLLLLLLVILRSFWKFSSYMIFISASKSFARCRFSPLFVWITSCTRFFLIIYYLFKTFFWIMVSTSTKISFFLNKI